jgi:hypothetical protein
MKKIFLLAAVAGLILSGCSDLGTNPGTNPVTTQKSNTVSLNKFTAKVTSNQSAFTVSKYVNGNKGGLIVLNQSSENIHAFALLRIPKNAFEGTENISITIDPSTASITLSPAMAFNKNLHLNAALKGLDLKLLNLDSKDVEFYYFTTDGSKVPVKHSRVRSNVKTGAISVKGAVIDHFSRYGWSK